MFNKIKSTIHGTPKVVDQVFQKAVAATGAVVDSETTKALKEKTYSAFESAKSIGKYLGDVNGEALLQNFDVGEFTS